MNTTCSMDEATQAAFEKPGAYLARQRTEKGYSVDYVAGKLHLRVRLIELLEADEYHLMPEPVFIRGYLRAYARLIEVPSDPLLETFNRLYAPERKVERALWQSRRQTHRGEHVVRWLTGVFVIGVCVAVLFWWQNNKETERLFSTTALQHEDVSHPLSESEIRLTDLSKMRSLLSSTGAETEAEHVGG